MNPCIGIISYLPDDKRREYRIKRMKLVLEQCNKLFNLPIIVIAQNWKEDCKEIFNQNMILFNYSNKLGISPAREELRKTFLNSDYDYMIMLDDDSIPIGTRLDAKRFLYLMGKNPDGAVLRRDNVVVKLIACSKNILSQVFFNKANPELNEGGEDDIFTWTLRTFYSDKIAEYDGNLTEMSNSTSDPHSTWANEPNIDKQLMARNSSKIKDRIKEERLNE